MKLSLKQKVAFGLGAVGKDMVYALSASYVMFYYQDTLHLSATFVGLILMIARVFDALNDPFMGILVAKTKARWGRMVSITVPAMLTLACSWLITMLILIMQTSQWLPFTQLNWQRVIVRPSLQ